MEGRSGYLRSALEALQIPADSQLLVFSRASLQGKLINEQNPRALFFNDRVALGWVRGGEIIEVAAHDESAVSCVYTLDQRTDAAATRPAVQSRIRVPWLPRGRRHARCARVSDVQHDTPPTGRRDSACRAPSIRATPSAPFRRLVRDREPRVRTHG